MEIKYNFEWIDKMVAEFEKTNKNPDYTVDEFVSSIIYPHKIFHWFMPGEQAIMSDPGNNNFAGDTDNYLAELYKYIEKYQPSKWWKFLIPKKYES